MTRTHRKGPRLQGTGQRDRWTTSYADFVTILLILFVAIAAQGFAIQATAPRIAQAPPPPVSIPPLETAIDPVFEGMVRDSAKLGLTFKTEPRGILITLEQGILFESGSDDLTRTSLPVVAAIGEALRKIPNRVDLIGHADSRPVHSKRFPSNWELSFARGMRLRDTLSKEFGIDANRLSIASQGASDPLAPDDTEEGRAANRRVEILILSPPKPKEKETRQKNLWVRVGSGNLASE